MFTGCAPSTKNEEALADVDTSYSARTALPHPTLQYLDNVLPFSAKVGGHVPRGTSAIVNHDEVSQLGLRAG